MYHNIMSCYFCIFVFSDVALQSVVEDQHRRQQRSRSSSVDLFELRPGDNRASKRGNYKGSCVSVNRMSLTLVETESIGLFLPFWC